MSPGVIEVCGGHLVLIALTIRAVVVAGKLRISSTISTVVMLAGDMVRIALTILAVVVAGVARISFTILVVVVVVMRWGPSLLRC